MKATRRIQAYRRYLPVARDMAISYEQEIQPEFYRDYIVRKVAKQHKVPYHLARSVIAYGQDQITGEIIHALKSNKQYFLNQAA